MSAVWVPPGRQTFFGSDGSPLSLGSVAHYIPTTFSPKLTWADEAQSVVNPTVIPLDAAGMCQVWGTGLYRQIVKDAAGVTIWDQITGFSETGNGSGDVLNVKDFGAVGNGSVDDGGAIQAAASEANSLGGAIVFFPPGRYKTTEPIDLTGMLGITLQGSGCQASQFISYGATIDTVLLSGSQYISIEGLGFNTSGTKSAGAAIHIAAGCTGVFLNQLWINAPYYGVWVDGASVLIWADELEIVTPTASVGVGVLINGGNDHYFNRTFVQGAPGAQPLGGFAILASGATWLNGCGALYTGHGLRVTPSDGQTVEHLFMANNAWDSGSGHGMLFQAVGTGVIRRIQSVGDWACTMGGSGVLFNSPAKEVFFTSLRAMNNQITGIEIANTSAFGVRVRDSFISGNSVSAPGTYPGVYIVAGATDFSIQNCKIGQAADLANDQSYGIYIEPGSSNNYQINGNNLLGNTVAALSDGGTGTTKIVADNLGSNINVRPTPTVNAVNDAGAAAAGVQIGGTYRNGSILMVRVS